MKNDGKKKKKPIKFCLNYGTKICGHSYSKFCLPFLSPFFSRFSPPPPPSSPFVVRILAFTTKHFERIVVKRREEYAWPLLHLSDNWFL